MKADQGKADQKLLPPGWRWRKLSDLCRQDRKIVVGESQGTARLPYLGLENIEAHSGRIQNEGSTSRFEEGISTTFFFSPDHVLYGKLRPYLNKVALPGFEGRCTTEIIPLLPDNGVDRSYLGWLLRRRETVDAAMLGKTGSRMPRASLAELLKLSVPVPPYPEQKRIAGILNERMAAIDKARAAAEAQLKMLEALPFAYVRVSLKGRELKEHLLDDCLEEVTQGIGSSYREFRMVGATRGGLAPAKEKIGRYPGRYKPITVGTIFYNPMRILIGSIAYAASDRDVGITSPDYVVLKTKQGILDDCWFYHWLRSPMGEKLIRALARGAVRERMLFSRLSKGKIYLPSYDAQCHAAARIRSVTPLINRIKIFLLEINALPRALLRQAFMGEL